MKINNQNLLSFGKLYVQRELGAILSDEQLEIRNNLLFQNNRYINNTNSSKLFGIDIKDENDEFGRNKDIFKILTQKLEQEGKDVFVIFPKNNKVVAQVRNIGDSYENFAKGKLLEQKCIYHSNPLKNLPLNSALINLYYLLLSHIDNKNNEPEIIND